MPTVDVIIEIGKRIILIERKNPPYGWALPGGFVEYGESVETAARREAKEEVSLDVQLTGLFGVFSDPDRDPRQHTISAVFTASAKGVPVAADDAKTARLFSEDDLPDNLAFDHAEILRRYFQKKRSNNDVITKKFTQ